MKKSLLFYFILQLSAFSSDVSAAKVLGGTHVKNIFIYTGETNNPVRIAEFVKLDVKGVQKLIGRKLSFIQKKLRRSVEKNGTVSIQKLSEPRDDSFRFDIGGFFLGLVLWLPGLIIAAIMDRKKKPKNIFKSAVIGFVISTALALAFAVSLMSTL